VILRTHPLVCQEAVELVTDYLEGHLSRRERRRFEKHLADCDGCSAYLDQIRQSIALTGRVGPDELSDATVDGLVELFERYRDDPST
jgi:anti-sigma factor RsiW